MNFWRLMQQVFTDQKHQSTKGTSILQIYSKKVTNTKHCFNLVETDLKPINSVKVFLHLSTPCLYTGQSAVQSKVDITAYLQMNRHKYCIRHVMQFQSMHYSS